MKVDFSSSSVIVIGDVMLDTYYTGSVKRISPEAPVPVVNIHKQNSVPGGAANVANNLISVQSHAKLLSVAGKDENQKCLSSLLDSLKIEYVLTEGVRPTTTKIRIVGNHQQIARLDFEEALPLSDSETDVLLKTFHESIQHSDTVVISDYAKGVCTEKLCNAVITECRKLNKKVIVDPKGRDWNKYKGANLITPNIHELSDAGGFDCGNDTDKIVQSANALRKKFDIGSILVTRSEKGMTLISENVVEHFKTVAREVYDVSGAGDTVVAILAAALSSGYDLYQAVRLSNTAAGISVGKFGTSPVTIDEISSAIHSDSGKSVFDIDDFLPVLKIEKEKGKKIVFTNGCFDILHRGHVEYLKEAKTLGDILVVGLNTDKSVKRLKGENRPINNQEDRAMILSALESVDYVVYFDEDTPLNLIKSIVPDYLVKGGDYTPETVVGKEHAKNTVIIRFVDGYSTTSTIEKMKTK
jgi:D-beta-D-heptose 7-phosphate kinase / D-beta-D-heptose 1-phosphate adenosyltransferase